MMRLLRQILLEEPENRGNKIPAVRKTAGTVYEECTVEGVSGAVHSFLYLCR